MDWDSRIIPFAKASKTQTLVRSNLASALGKNNLPFYRYGFFCWNVGRSFGCQDFHVIQGDHVNTTCLPEYTLRWYRRVLSMSDGQRQECHVKTQRCLIKVQSHCFTLLNETKGEYPLIPEVCLSIRILGESLSQTKHSIWQNILGCNPAEYVDTRGKWGKSSLVERLLTERKWCPNEITFLQY